MYIIQAILKDGGFNLIRQVFNFLGEAVKTVFKGIGGASGGKAGFPRNEEAGPGTEELVEALPVLMKKPYAEQLVGLLSLLSSNKPQITPLTEGNVGSKINGKISHFLYGNKNRNVNKNKAQTSKNFKIKCILLQVNLLYIFNYCRKIE